MNIQTPRPDDVARLATRGPSSRQGSGTRHPRRSAFAALVAVVAVGLVALCVAVLAPGGWSVVEILLLICFAANAPWLSLAAATGIIGLIIRLASPDPAAIVVPLPSGALDAPIILRTVLAVCVREEAMDDVLAPLAALLTGLDRAGVGDRFGIAILSDTPAGAHAVAEAAAIAGFAAHIGQDRVFYRRRPDNAGFKAGNVMEFLDNHAEAYDLMLALDADSAMEARAVLRLVRTMQARPELALLQSTIAGHGADAPFARLMGLGHRPGSLTWAIGQGWWQQDEGPFWGHNAVLRIAPFRAHCRLPLLPGGGHILSHDHVEAALLHGAGWAVRVVPDDGDVTDGGSYERHPPNLPVFLDRDRRWATGNMQYRYFLRDRALGLLGRFQMLQAILHYALAPLWFAMLPLAALNATLDGEATPRGLLLLLLVLAFASLHLPRLGGHAITILRTPAGNRGARLREALAESGFLLLFDPITAFDKTVTVLAHAFGRARAGWPSTQRSARRVGWREAATRLWPHTLCGAAILALFATSGSWFALLVGLPAVAGLVLAIPFCVLTACPDTEQRSHRMDAGGAGR